MNGGKVSPKRRRPDGMRAEKGTDRCAFETQTLYFLKKKKIERRPTAMKKYSNPKLEIVELTTVDVLTLSGESIIPPIVADPNESPSIPLG